VGLVIGWRRRLGCGAAIFFLAAAVDATDITVALVDGAIEVSGLSQEVLDARGADAIVSVAVSTDAPAIVGAYHVDGGTLSFRPMFPFDPGREYVVRVDAGGEPVVATVSLPPRDIEPSTIVTAVYPTAATLPENQLKLYIHFSAPMAGGDGLPFVKLLDANGVEVADPFLPLGDAFWDPEFRRYTVFFDPGRVTPMQELGVGIDVVDEREHLIGAIGHASAAMNDRHAG